MKLMDFLVGQSPKTKQLPTMTPEQQGVFSQLLQMLSGGGQGGQGGMNQAQNVLQDWMNPSQESYDRFAAPYMQQFQQETLPGIAERYAGAGGNANSGALQSSAFGQALGGAGANLQTNLAGMKTGLQNTAMQHIMELLKNAMGTQSFAYQQRPGSEGLLQGAIKSGIGSAAGSWAANRFGGGGAAPAQNTWQTPWSNQSR